MALSIGITILCFLLSCYSSYVALNSYPDGTLTHCSCQPSLDAHFPVLIQPDFLEGRSRQYTTRRLYAHVDTFQDAGQMDDGCGSAVRDSWPSLRALYSTVRSEKVVVEIRA
jgi:hypothetical protein